jgi:hypothetical protein
VDIVRGDSMEVHMEDEELLGNVGQFIREVPDYGIQHEVYLGSPPTWKW